MSEIGGGSDDGMDITGGSGEGTSGSSHGEDGTETGTSSEEFSSAGVGLGESGMEAGGADFGEGGGISAGGAGFGEGGMEAGGVSPGEGMMAGGASPGEGMAVGGASPGEGMTEGGMAQAELAVSGGRAGTEISEPGMMEHTETEKSTDIPIDITRTTPGRCQILETFPTMEEAQRSIESYHKQSVDQILVMNGNYISEQGKERLQNGITSIQAVEHNPGSHISGSFSFHNNQSSMKVANITVEQMERTTKHETNHFASFNREIIVPGDKGHTVYKTSGIRQTSYFQTSRGERLAMDSRNRGMNEGLTTMYTNEQLMALDPAKGQAAARQNSYQHATEICRQMEEILGRETMAKAYYGGDLKGLEGKVNELAGEKSFESLSRCLDRVTYSTNPAERVTAMKEAQEILAKMSEGSKKA